MAGYRAKPVKGSTLRRGDPLAKGLTGAWLFDDKNGPTVRDALRQSDGTTAGSPAWGSGRRGPVLSCGTTDYVSLGLTDTLLGLSDGTVLLVQRKRDTTLRVSSAVGTSLDAGGPKRVNCHMPYSDGTVYWDWGGFSGGSSRLAVSGLTWDTDEHVWVLSVGGGLGMRVYRDGVLVGSNSGTPSRTADATNVLRANDFTGGANSGDSAEYSAVLTWNRALTPTQVRLISADPFRPWRRRSVAVLKAGAAVATGPAWFECSDPPVRPADRMIAL